MPCSRAPDAGTSSTRWIATPPRSLVCVRARERTPTTLRSSQRQALAHGSRRGRPQQRDVRVRLRPVRVVRGRAVAAADGVRERLRRRRADLPRPRRRRHRRGGLDRSDATRRRNPVRPHRGDAYAFGLRSRRELGRQGGSHAAPLRVPDIRSARLCRRGAVVLGHGRCSSTTTPTSRARRSPATAAFLARGQTCTLLLDPARFFWIAALSSTELSRTETHRSTSHAAITMSPWRCCASNMAPKLTGFRLPARRPSRSRARMAMPT